MTKPPLCIYDHPPFKWGGGINMHGVIKITTYITIINQSEKEVLDQIISWEPKEQVMPIECSLWLNRANDNDSYS